MAGFLVWSGQLWFVFILLVVYRFFLEKTCTADKGLWDLFFSKTAVFWIVLLNQKEMEF